MTHRLPTLILLSLYTGSCNNGGWECPDPELLAPATYQGTAEGDADMHDIVLEVVSQEQAILSWTDANGAHTETYDIELR